MVAGDAGSARYRYARTPVNAGKARIPTAGTSVGPKVWQGESSGQGSIRIQSCPPQGWSSEPVHDLAEGRIAALKRHCIP
jgi:hypothetical protein